MNITFNRRWLGFIVALLYTLSLVGSFFANASSEKDVPVCLVAELTDCEFDPVLQNDFDCTSYYCDFVGQWECPRSSVEKGVEAQYQTIRPAAPGEQGFIPWAKSRSIAKKRNRVKVASIENAMTNIIAKCSMTGRLSSKACILFTLTNSNALE